MHSSTINHTCCHHTALKAYSKLEKHPENWDELNQHFRTHPVRHSHLNRALLREHLPRALHREHLPRALHRELAPLWKGSICSYQDTPLTYLLVSEHSSHLLARIRTLLSPGRCTLTSFWSLQCLLGPPPPPHTHIHTAPAL
jgi:hypothetical protein